MARWSRRSFQVQHWDELRARGNIDLYEGNALATVDRVQTVWRDLEASLLFRCQLIKGIAWNLRGRSFLAAARLDGDQGRLATVMRDARKLRREGVPWATAYADLLTAGACDCRGQKDDAVRALGRAIEGFDALGKKLHAAAARHRLGALLGGDEGKALLAECDAYMAAEGVKVPMKAIAMIAPGFAD